MNTRDIGATFLQQDSCCQALDAAAAEEPSLVTVPVAAAVPQSVAETVAPAAVTPAPAEGKDRMEWMGWMEWMEWMGCSGFYTLEVMNGWNFPKMEVWFR